MHLKREYYLQVKEDISRIEKSLQLGEEFLSDMAKKELEKYYSIKFEKIKSRVEENQKKRKTDEELKQNFEKIIVKKALKIAKKLYFNIEVEADEKRGIIQFISGIFIINDMGKKEFIELLEKSDSIQMFSKDKTTNVILEYNFAIKTDEYGYNNSLGK